MKDMRRILCVAAVASLVGATVGAHLGQSPGQLQEIQKVTNDTAEKYAQEIADRAKATVLGALTSRANIAFIRWGQAIAVWKKEKNAGAAPLLAEGVLFDCLGRLQ